MGFFRKVEDKIKNVGRKIDDEIIQPVKENPAAAAGLALMFVPGLQGVGASIGSAIAPAAGAAVQAGIGNAIIQGALTEAQGGDFLKGAALSGLGSVVSGAIQPGLSEALGGGAAGNIASNALVGGGMSELSGGDFTTGALISGIGSGINEAKLAAADDYINSVEPGIGYDASTSPTELDVLDAIAAEQPSYTISDTSFTPDYSLATGAPVIPDMGAQGIQVPTISELVDVVNQPVDYSLPVPDSGLGFQMPTAPNLGDPNSFINQPAPNVDVNIPELTEQQPTDINKELALLDAAKALAPLAVTSLLADKVINQPEEQPTGFEIVPVPSDWKSPEYNMAFTPSEAINFGSPEMLAGTQWANAGQQPTQMPYSLSDVINTLNYQSVPFVQQQYQMPQQSFSVPDILQQFQTSPTVGMNDVIGGLNGRQVSISDIISGIQSQYG